ncbi:MAG: 50S ribosomal protein L25 [Candidatus Nealsonbacteria bacterium CG23_combo_of_CG06-09_8_20_14_all_40_13]|uniref:Large ribosomal subunit protein bL25 n=1 Tax=Candidatus Nealsonbacteria bacterium CG23_combo_of_CG06-09_8_20_14_all_40_13 TaxID=1974724 RepID=A0A2G9YR72_9BACT|nr:MAG: 50S ribosomal protein L25 [Candidatus Nealsonbacteria bacterium CG23_combo_of_CG06-09_8_20_14_all_40_13]PIR71295.1 MAG: 50S ribosomal protein L25 [Candidatus Nealsonbacteria bacterium CG10_big_fil_rev_8_21_14_0_10_40_24]PIU43250.1 MAG: 50S ribosomal protein L25 [Candidatus Nealsonbacteria bacterium CG07_land_8_20_14_0_80_40_10]
MHETLQADKRQLIGKTVKRLREQGMLPAVLYGHQFETLPLTVPKNEFEKVFKKAGSSSLVDLKIEKDEPIKILIHSIQKDPVSDELIHTDFYKVKMTEKIRTNVPLHFVGESKAVKELEGNLIANKDTIGIECLPDALVNQIEVDISVLQTFEDKIKVSDLKIPANIAVLDDGEEIVASVEEPRSEAELAELGEEVKEEEEIEKVEAIGEKKVEEGEEVAEEGVAEEKSAGKKE